MMDWVKKYKNQIILCLVVFLVIIPLMIHVLFKIEAPNDFLQANWTSGDILSFYGTVLASISTAVLGIFSLYQNHLYKQQSDQIMQLQNVPYFSYVNLEPMNVPLNKDSKEELDPCVIYLDSPYSQSKIILSGFDAKNMSDYPICAISLKCQVLEWVNKEWVYISGQEKYKKFIIPAKSSKELFIAIKPDWLTIHMMGYKNDLIGVEISFTNTNGLTTSGRIIFYKDMRVCSYHLIPLPIEDDYIEE